jgi:protein-S-isoprenylcysteine O-methyltransferase Ste14
MSLRKLFLTISAISGVFAVGLAYAGLKGVMPDRKLLGTIVLVFVAVCVVLVQTTFRNSRKKKKGAGAADKTPAATERFYQWARHYGRLYLLTGSAALILGIFVEKYKVPLMITGAVVLPFAAYLLFVSRKPPEQKNFRREAAR